jgi:hypothetical protein
MVVALLDVVENFSPPKGVFHAALLAFSLFQLEAAPDEPILFSFFSNSSRSFSSKLLNSIQK